VIPLSLGEAAAACGGRLQGADPDAIVTGITVDSRTVHPGDLFVGLRGGHADGDDFASAALKAGAAAVVVRPGTADAMRSSTPRIAAEDGLQALGALAAAVRRRSPARVVAITGSAGKTSTKDILTALLAPVARVVATRGNFNNEIGVPLTVFELEPDTEVLVCELAMRGRGQIAELAAVVKPDIGVITNIAPVHLELVGTIEEVAAAKAEIIGEAGRGGLVVPVDEALLEPHLRYHTGRLVTFGLDRGDVCVVEARTEGLETHALIDAFGHRATFDFSFSGGHYLSDALAALGAFVGLGYRLEEAKPGARAIEFSALRGRITALPGDGLLLNDAYNANPLSMKAAIDHLCEVAGERPKVGLLGDMFELGRDAAAFHREVGEHASARGVAVLAAGELAREYVTGAGGGEWFETVDALLAALPGALAPGSAVLVKASRGMRFERVAAAVEALAAKRPTGGQRGGEPHGDDRPDGDALGPRGGEG